MNSKPYCTNFLFYVCLLLFSSSTFYRTKDIVNHSLFLVISPVFYVCYLGELVKRLLGHYTSTELFSAPGNPYFLSNAVMDREETFRIWSTDTFQCVTSFRHDTYVSITSNTI